jgi:hypothetical protein
MKIIAGASLLARLKVAETSLLDSPTHLFKTLESLMGIKTALLSLATALANIVLPEKERLQLKRIEVSNQIEIEPKDQEYSEQISQETCLFRVCHTIKFPTVAVPISISP